MFNPWFYAYYFWNHHTFWCKNTPSNRLHSTTWLTLQECKTKLSLVCVACFYNFSLHLDFSLMWQRKSVIYCFIFSLIPQASISFRTKTGLARCGYLNAAIVSRTWKLRFTSDSISRSGTGLQIKPDIRAFRLEDFNIKVQFTIPPKFYWQLNVFFFFRKSCEKWGKKKKKKRKEVSLTDEFYGLAGVYHQYIYKYDKKKKKKKYLQLFKTYSTR